MPARCSTTSPRSARRRSCHACRARPRRRPVRSAPMWIASHTVARELDAVGVERIFDVVVAEDVLPKVLHRWGPVPAVTGTAEVTGPWDTPGSERTVLLEDGSTAHEQVLTWERPERFEYRVGRLSNPLGRLIDHALGSWEFSATERGSRFVWTYS